MEEEKLIRYIQGTMTSEEEVTQMLDWIEASPTNRERYTEYKTLWVITGLERVKKQHSVKFFARPVRAKTASPDFAGSLIRYAAVFIFAFLTGAAVLYLTGRHRDSQLYHTYNEIHVPGGEKSAITLYDGTKVWLNSGTTFKYPVAFHSRERKVYVNGEAYFDVSQKKNQPFLVEAGQLEIKVTGTRFNVCAYHADEEFFVTLEEGSVQARSGADGQELVLLPGEQAVFYRQSNRLVQTKVDPLLYSSWKEDLLRFRDAPFKEVIKKMERWYDVDITADGSVDTEETYTMTIKTESLREMLNVLSKTTPIKYEINGKKVLITRHNN